MKKYLTIFAAMLLGITACNKKQKTPEEYFSFDANGVHYEYAQEETPTTLFGGGYNTLGALTLSGNLGFKIYAFSQKDPTAPGEFEFLFFNGIPTQDTIVLGQSGTSVGISKFLVQTASYDLDVANSGKIIFSQKTSTKLEGIFEFTSKDRNSGNTLNITNGKFFIKLY